jgi:hypothetical protein
MSTHTRKQLSEGISILYRVHDYLYKAWLGQLNSNAAAAAEYMRVPSRYRPDEGVRLAMKVIVDVRGDMIDERSQMDEAPTRIA